MHLKRLRNVLRHSTALAKRFSRDARGNTSIIFGLTSIPLAMIASMSVDYGNSVRIKNELQAAADAGVLAAATALASGEDETSKDRDCGRYSFMQTCQTTHCQASQRRRQRMSTFPPNR